MSKHYILIREQMEELKEATVVHRLIVGCFDTIEQAMAAKNKKFPYDYEIEEWEGMNMRLITWEEIYNIEEKARQEAEDALLRRLRLAP